MRDKRFSNGANPLMGTSLIIFTLQIIGCVNEDISPSKNLITHFPEIEHNLHYTPSNERITNLEASIPPQCYTRTEQTHNPCYVCHQNYERKPTSPYRMNKLDDGALQGHYLFSDLGKKNHWANLFLDRTQYVAGISDEAILTYINQDNYTPLKNDLKARNWQGFIPDLEHLSHPERAFDSGGHARDGSRWVAFNYKPFPSTFWPTNGSTDDVAIRLPEAFSSINGQYSRAIYHINLAAVEANIKSLSYISVNAFNEQSHGIDINGDGVLSNNQTHLKIADNYFGDASTVHREPQQYPAGTEFLHSVRYVGINDAGDIIAPPRMKELRYMVKIRTLSNVSLDNRYRRERKEKVDDQLPHFTNLHERGLENNFGWLLSGFIEDKQGQLRPQTTEETLACMGCHSAVGSTIDQTFAFARKVTGVNGWGYINLKGMHDVPNINSATPEILEYLQRTGGGDEFRHNQEMLNRWFDDKGHVNVEAVLNADVYTLITPSRERALLLNKAYTYIVKSQRYVFGRDANWAPAKNVFDYVDSTQSPLNSKHQLYGWDLRLNWSSIQAASATETAP